MYFLPTTTRADFYFKVILPSVTYGLDWYTPSDQVLAQSKWPTVEDLYEYRLLTLAHNCFYNYVPVPIMKLFTKYECNYNFQRKLNWFSKGKVRKNVAWKRIADRFNTTSSVNVTGEQCSNKWKMLKEKYKKVTEHNSRTRNERKEGEFQNEMTEFFGSNPKIVPTTTVSSMAMEAERVDHSHDEDEELPRQTLL